MIRKKCLLSMCSWLNVWIWNSRTWRATSLLNTGGGRGTNPVSLPQPPTQPPPLSSGGAWLGLRAYAKPGPSSHLLLSCPQVFLMRTGLKYTTLPARPRDPSQSPQQGPPSHFWGLPMSEATGGSQETPPSPALAWCRLLCQQGANGGGGGAPSLPVVWSEDSPSPQVRRE